MMLSFNEAALRSYLPGLYNRLMASCSEDIGALIDQLAATSEEIFPYVKYNPYVHVGAVLIPSANTAPSIA